MTVDRHRMWKAALKFALLQLALSAGAGTCWAGSVVSDGSLGSRAGSVPKDADGAYSVVPGLGRQVGQNLFQSFSQFSLDRGEVATFSGRQRCATYWRT